VRPAEVLRRNYIGERRGAHRFTDSLRKKTQYRQYTLHHILAPPRGFHRGNFNGLHQLCRYRLLKMGHIMQAPPH
jgi:hypothetical protein